MNGELQFGNMDHYMILGVNPRCGKEDIKVAYRKLARKYHPDKNKGKDNGMFQKVSIAHSILSDPELRLAYDKYRIKTGAHYNNSFISSIGRTKTRKRKKKYNNRKEGRTTSPTCPEDAEKKKRRPMSKRKKQDGTFDEKENKEEAFQKLFKEINKGDTTLYNGAPQANCTKILVGILKNIQGGKINIPYKSIHHEDMLKDLEEDKIEIHKKDTSLETERGDITMRKEKIIYYNDGHEVDLPPLGSYPRSVVIPEAGSSIGIDRKKYKNRADLKIEIDFSPTFNEQGDDEPIGLWQFFDNSHPLIPKLPGKLTQRIHIMRDEEKRLFEPGGLAYTAIIDCVESKYYSSKIGELDVLTINLPIKPCHVTNTGLCAQLQLLDGRRILIRYTKREFKRLMATNKKILSYGPAVPHAIIREGGYNYRVTNKTTETIHLGRSPLVVIFTMMPQ